MAENPSKTNSVLIVVNTNLRRGAEVFGEQLRDGLIDQGWYAATVSLTAAPSGPVTSAVPVTEIEPGTTGRFSWRILRALRREIYESDPDVILAMGGPTLRYCVMASTRARGSLAYLGIGEATYWIRSGFSRFVNKWLLGKPDQVMAVSADSLDKIMQIQPEVAENAHVAYIGVADEFFAIQKGARGEKLRVLVLGALTPEKNPELALQAVSLVDNVEARFVGSGSLRESLERESSRRGLTDRVEFAGAVDDVGVHLAWADVLLLTSRTEGLPGAVLEAAASGTAVVAVDVGGVKEAVRHEETGLVVAGDDAAALGSAIGRLASDREACRSMGSAGRSLAAELFTMGAAVGRFAVLLEKAA